MKLKSIVFGGLGFFCVWGFFVVVFILLYLHLDFFFSSVREWVTSMFYTNILCFHFGTNYLLPVFSSDKQKHSLFLPFSLVGI